MTETANTTVHRRAFAIDLQHLRFAVVASDSGSLRQAAELLSVGHSSLSRSIGQLEHLIGTTLFERSSSGVKPTLAGQGVLRIARLILEQLDSLVETGRSIAGGEAGRISIGFCTSISTGNLRATLVEFKRRFSSVDLTTVERSRVHLANALRSGTIDVAISPGPLPLVNCNVITLWNEPILLTLPEHHALAEREAVYWTDLRKETILLSKHDPGRELEDLLVSKLLRTEDRPTIQKHDVSGGILKALTSMGFGIALTLESDIGANIAGLVHRELQDGAGPSRISFLAHWRQDNINPALERFLKLLGERYPSASLPVG